jgi:FKBP-type peptidyl-prolyl cis-trans isomerase
MSHCVSSVSLAPRVRRAPSYTSSLRSRSRVVVFVGAVADGHNESAAVSSFESTDRGKVTPPMTRATTTTTRRAAVTLPALLLATAHLAANPDVACAQGQDRGCDSCSDSNSALADGDKKFVSSPSGLRYLDLKVGDGAECVEGKRAVVDWVGYTAGYQAKKIESTRETDEPFVFVVGGGQAIPGFEEAVRGMRVGGVRRIEIPGELEEKLGYSRDKSMRYSVGPKPTTFGGQRALDFVLDNETLRDFNRTLLFDIRLSALR